MNSPIQEAVVSQVGVLLLGQVLPCGVAELPFELVITLSTKEIWAATSAPALYEGQLLLVVSTR